MSEFLASNDWQWRLLRTIVQGVLGVVIANLDLIMGWCVLDPSMRWLVMALVMALLPMKANLNLMLSLRTLALKRSPSSKLLKKLPDLVLAKLRLLSMVLLQPSKKKSLKLMPRL